MEEISINQEKNPSDWVGSGNKTGRTDRAYDYRLEVNTPEDMVKSSVFSVDEEVLLITFPSLVGGVPGPFLKERLVGVNRRGI